MGSVGYCLDEEEDPPGWDLSCGGSGDGGCDGSEVVCGRGPDCVHIFRVGEMVGQEICVKHSGIRSGETRLAC